MYSLLWYLVPPGRKGARGGIGHSSRTSKHGLPTERCGWSLAAGNSKSPWGRPMRGVAEVPARFVSPLHSTCHQSASSMSSRNASTSGRTTTPAPAPAKATAVPPKAATRPMACNRRTTPGTRHDLPLFGPHYAPLSRLCLFWRLLVQQQW